MPRLKFLFGLFSFGISVIFIRLVYLQVFQHSKYSVLAARQHFSVMELSSPRGLIQSSDGFLLAGNEARFLLFAEPKKITDETGLAEKLLPILKPELYAPKPYLRDIKAIKNYEQNLVDALSRKDLFWVALEHNLTTESKYDIEVLGVTGLGFASETVRFYPEGSLAREILGTVGRDLEGNPRGYFGIEGYYEGDLRGLGGEVYQEQNAFGQPILVGNYLEVPAKPGKNLLLTINRTIQYILEQKLGQGITKYGAQSATGVILDPRNGEILAMSSKYLNSDPEATISGVPRNLAIASAYEPGSVMKPLTIAAAIDSHLITPETTYDDNGPVTYSTHLVDNWDGEHHGKITMTQILELSNNCGAAWVGTQLGSYNLRDYLLKFGLGNPLGVDLEGETGGIIRDPQEWREIDTATASFGQGISASPLQVVNIFATIANGGNLIRPHLVKADSQIVRQVISGSTASTVSQMLVSAVDKGESRYFNLKDFTVAGKTGTAQIAIDGHYDPQKTNTTFVGYFPKDPKFVMLIKLEKPSTSIYAAETAVPLWMSIAKELALEMRIVPDR